MGDRYLFNLANTEDDPCLILDTRAHHFLGVYCEADDYYGRLEAPDQWRRHDPG